jgi:hypothetical protein
MNRGLFTFAKGKLAAGRWPSHPRANRDRQDAFGRQLESYSAPSVSGSCVMIGQGATALPSCRSCNPRCLDTSNKALAFANGANIPF